jgi:hypothetical protein
MADPGDPVLAAMEAAPPPMRFDPLDELPDERKPGYMPYMDPSVWTEIANHDQEYYRRLIRRFSRDVMLYRQRYSEKPPGFDPKREIAFRAASISNIVNKLTNMSSPLDFRYNVPFKDEVTKRASQIMENGYGYWRTCEEIEYASAGGHTSLQWDEFFYDFLYGRICCRVLPAPHRKHMPFDIELLDPATVFPIWGGTTEGLVRLTHRRPMTAIDVISTYLPFSPNLDSKIAEWTAMHFGSDSEEYRKYYHQERELLEGWDTWRRIVKWGDIVVLEDEHKLGEVPFIYVTARGEPRGMTTPQGKYWIDRYDLGISAEDAADLYINVTAGEDQAEKGVSVFHHVVNTHRMTEVVYTLLLTEVIKSGKPATITYGGPLVNGMQPDPLDFKPGGANYRLLNAQRVEIAPTSPRPTDTSPVLNKLTGEMTEGTINNAAFGNVEGSNIAGYAIESMIAATKDTVLPYLRCWEIFQQLKSGMMHRFYKKVIAPLGTTSIPMEGKYGGAPSADLTPDVLDSAGDKVTVEIIGVSDQQLPMLVNAAGAAVERGFWSRRYAMEKLGEKDPSRMNQEIIIERALEHPEMMENFLIPINFIRSGQKDLADLWVLMIVMPKIQMLMSKMLGPMAQGPMAGIEQSGAAMPPGLTGAPPGAPPMLPPGDGTGAPDVNGQSNPMAGRARGAPTGPQPGQGRGPAPAGLTG